MSTSNSSIRLVNEREIPDPAPMVLPTKQQARRRSRIKLPKPDLAATLGHLKGSAMILNARALLLLALIAAACLGYLAVTAPDTPRLVASAIFDLFVFLPIVALYVFKGGTQ